MQLSNFLLVQGLANAGVATHLQVFSDRPGAPPVSPAASTVTHQLDLTKIGSQFACARAVLRRTAELRPDVVLLLDDAVVRALGFIRLSLKSGQKCASVNSGSVLTRTNTHWRGRGSAFFVRRGYRWLDRIFVADSTALALKTGFPDVADRVRVLGRPVPDVFFHHNDRDRLSLFDNSLPTLFSCSRADEQKGIQLILRALALMRDRAGREVANFVYAGDGPALESWRRLASSQGLTNVRFVGTLPFESVRAYYASCDMCVFPTIYPDETFGRTWVEAFACGKPVISTHINNLKYLVKDGVNGIVVRPDAEGVAEGIMRALSLSPASLEQMSRRATDTALPYKQSVLVEDLLKSLRELR